MPRKDETEIAIGVMQVAVAQPDGLATFRLCYATMPSFMNFSSEDNAPSPTRPGETMWQQQVRNLKSHDATSAVGRGWLEHVPETGYRLTDAGRSELVSRGLHP